MTTRVAASQAAVEPGQPARGRRSVVHRYPVDLVRVGLGLAIVGIGLLIAQRGQLSVFERDVFQIINDLPPLFFPVVWAVMQLGNVVAVPILAAVAALARRFRMARDLLVSGLLAYLAADLIKSLVRRERPGGFAVDPFFPEGPIEGLGFISGHAAVAAALATAAAPYLTRRTRRVAWGVAAAVAISRIYVGAHLPLDIIGGAAAGWAIGSLVHWAFGLPRWEPSARRVGALLARYGLPVRDLRPSTVVARSSHPFEAVDETGRRVYVKVLDPDRFERDWLYRLYRVVAVRDIKDADAVAPLGQQAEHEAVAAMTARERGVRVPPVLLARGNQKGAVLVQEYRVGTPLDELLPDDVTPGLLAEVWHQLALLRGARIAHNDLVTSSVLVDADGKPWLVDFGNAVTGADDDDLAGDVAELMASLAMRLDPVVVADSAVDALGADVVAEALTGLMPLTLSAATRHEEREQPGRLSALRRAVRARLDLPDPDRYEFAPAGRVAVAAVTAGAALVLVGVPLLADSASLLETVEHNGWRWLGAALALAVVARAATAAAGLFTVERRLALGRTYGASMVADGASLLHGHTGWRRAAVRYLERAGVLPDAARRAMDRFSAGAIVAAVLVALVTLVLAVVEGEISQWGAPEAAVPAMLLGAGAWVLVLTGQWLAARHAAATQPGSPAPARLVTQAVRRALARTPDAGHGSDPWRRGAQFAWAATAVVLEGATLAAALHGVGGQVPVLATATVYAALHLLWSAVPITGAPGAADVALLLALTSLGAPLAAAVAGVVTFRLLTFWIPAALGALLSGRFEHRFVT